VLSVGTLFWVLEDS